VSVVRERKKLVVAVIGSLCALSACAPKAPPHVADTIFYGGPIVTVNEKQPEVSALAVRDGDIMAVGDAAEIVKAHGSDSTEMIDLKGRTLMPGFVEPHVHISLTAITEHIALNLSNFSLPYDTIESLVKKLRDYKATLPEGSWIIAFGVDPSRTTPVMAELTADILDTVSTTNPIFVVNQSGHIAYVNHKALEDAGITESSPDPGNGGVYVRDAKGKLTGKLIEPPSYSAFAKKMTPPSKEVFIDAYKKTVQNMSSKGITTSAEIAVGAVLPLEEEHAMIEEVTHKPNFPFRIRGYLWGVALPEGFSSIDPGEGDDMFRVIGVKYITDGSTQGLTAALKEPYKYPAGTRDRGALDWEDEKLLSVSKPLFDQGWQLSLHANGDRAIEQTLNLYERLLQGDANPAARRLRIEHFTVTSEEQVARAQKLGVAPSMTIGHVGFWGEVFHNHVLGHERAERIDPTGSLAKRGVRFSFHSDSPVSPYGPLRYISTGASRLWQKPPRRVLGPKQRLAVDQAIKAVTLDAAYAMFLEDRVGSLEPGKWADLVVLDKNPRSTDANSIEKIKVLETWLNGKRAFSSSYNEAGKCQ
jgi:predicted amidohydrolase YtcJ